MATDYDEVTFPEQQLHCDNCGWSGSGNEAHLIDFYGATNVKQVECPNCNTILGNLKSSRNGSDDTADPLSISIG